MVTVVWSDYRFERMNRPNGLNPVTVYHAVFQTENDKANVSTYTLDRNFKSPLGIVWSETNYQSVQMAIASLRERFPNMELVEPEKVTLPKAAREVFAGAQLIGVRRVKA
jgi:hypothetical protein